MKSNLWPAVFFVSHIFPTFYSNKTCDPGWDSYTLDIILYILYQQNGLTWTYRRRLSSGCDMDTSAFKRIKSILILYSADSLLITTIQFVGEQYPFIIIRLFLFLFLDCCDKIWIVHSMFFSIYWLRQTFYLNPQTQWWTKMFSVTSNTDCISHTGPWAPV